MAKVVKVLQPSLIQAKNLFDDEDAARIMGWNQLTQSYLVALSEDVERFARNAFDVCGKGSESFLGFCERVRKA